MKMLRAKPHQFIKYKDLSQIDDSVFEISQELS